MKRTVLPSDWSSSPRTAESRPRRPGHGPQRYLPRDDRERPARLLGCRSTGRSGPGQFLNTYEPLVDPEFLRQWRLDTRKGSIAEACSNFNPDTTISPRASPFPTSIFSSISCTGPSLTSPDELDGYVRTYSGPRKDENLAFALDGLRGRRFPRLDRTIRMAEGSVAMLRGRSRDWRRWPSFANHFLIARRY